MKSLIIITDSFFDFDKRAVKIGGLETYINDLALLALKQDMLPTVYQVVNRSEEIKVNGYSIKTAYKPRSLFKSLNQRTFESLYEKLNSADTVFIIATDQMSIKTKAHNVIVIQHGVAFDIPGYMISGFWGKTHFLQYVNKFLRCERNVMRFNNVQNTVCVDYNYYNWLKTIGTIYPGKAVRVIPNYASSIISREDLDSKLTRIKSEKKVIFARRFVDYRGTMLFANVAKRLLQEYKNVIFTFAGSGPLEKNIRDMFIGESRVKFTSFKPDESVQFHYDYDIAVVPTIYSEGTSLSLLEAMAAGCLPIATYVGGMSNIVLDGYNGLLVYPDEDSIYNSILYAINMNKDSFNKMVGNAYDTIVYSFSKSKWEISWGKMLNNILK